MSLVHGNMMWRVLSCVTLVLSAVGRKITGSLMNQQRPLPNQFLTTLPFSPHPVSLCRMSPSLWKKLSSLSNVPLIQSLRSVISSSPKTPYLPLPIFTLIHLSVAPPLFPQIIPPPHLNFTVIHLPIGPPPFPQITTSHAIIIHHPLVVRLFTMALHLHISPLPQILTLLHPGPHHLLVLHQKIQVSGSHRMLKHLTGWRLCLPRLYLKMTRLSRKQRKRRKNSWQGTSHNAKKRRLGRWLP